MNIFNRFFLNYSLKWKAPNTQLFRTFTSNYGLMKVTVIGAAGRTGQPLCLMLKQSPLIDELNIHDIKSTSGLGLELNHIDTKCKVFSFSGRDNLQHALKNSKVVVVIAAAPGTETMPNDKMLEPNSLIIKEIVTEVARCCPKALLTIATNPVNSTVPLASEILKKAGCYNPNFVFGITSLDSVRANTFVAKIQGIEPETVTVPIIGGHSTETIVPVLSHAKPCAEFTDNEIEDITANIRNVHTNLIQMQFDEGQTLSSAFAAARLVISLVKAIQGYPEIVETAYVSSKEHPPLKYLATPLLLGPNGILRNLGIPKLNDFEQCVFDNAVPVLLNDITEGEKSAGVYNPPPPCDPCGPPKMSPCPGDWCEIQR